MTRRWTKRLAIGAAVVAALAATGGAIWFRVHGYAFGPEQARIEYGDVERFVAAAAALPTASDSAAHVEREYLGAASRGLASYASMYGLDGERLVGALRSYPRYYGEPDDLLRRVRATEPSVRRALAKFEEIYPRAMYPPVYYLIGGARAGGANSHAGVLIAVELYGRETAPPGQDSVPGESDGPTDDPDERTASDERTAFDERTASDARSDSDAPPFYTRTLPCLVAHELAHFNQFVASPIAYSREWGNLARAIKEGAADFIAELSAGCHASVEAHAWATSRERELWEEFRTVLDSDDPSGWFWGGDDSERPSALGYFVGYRIVRTFYERSDDKASAIRRIMNIADFEGFLDDSGYAEAMAGAR